MVGDRDVLVAERASGRSHLLQGRPPVAFGGVHMQVATDVPHLDQLGKAILSGALDLAQVFAQLRRNQAQAQRFVHLSFGLAGDAGVVIAAVETVFAQLETHLDGAGTQGDVMVLASGEVLQRGAEALARQRPHIHLQALATHFGAGLILAARQHLVDAWKMDEPFQHLGGGRTGDQEIQVADGLATAPEAAGRA